MRLSRQTALALATLLALLAVALGYMFLRGKKPPPEVVQRVQVPVPIADIPVETDLRRDMFKQASFDPEQLPKDAISDPDDLHGQFALQELPQSQPVRPSAIASRSTALAMAYGIPENYRAITIPVDDVSGVANFIRPGDHIDLLAIFTDTSGNYSTVQTVLQDVLVLAINAVTTPPEGDQAKEEQEAKPKSRRGEESRTATIAVTPHQAQLVALSHHRGEIRLILRRTGDRRIESLGRSQSWSLIGSFPVRESREPALTATETQPPSWAEMWGGPPVERPPVAPEKPKPKPSKKEPAVEVIRGSSREFVKPEQ